MKKVFVSLVALLGLIFYWGSKQASDFATLIEIAPNEWLTVELERGRAGFRCNWKGKEVFWPGKAEFTEHGLIDWQLPLTLRSWKDSLYLIYRDTSYMSIEDFDSIHFARLNSLGNGFEEMRREEFPRAIATLNFSIHLDGMVHDENNQPVDRFDILRRLDASNRYFINSYTANIWIRLELGCEYVEAFLEGDKVVEEQLAFFRHYVRKYHPIALPNLIP